MFPSHEEFRGLEGTVFDPTTGTNYWGTWSQALPAS